MNKAINAQAAGLPQYRHNISELAGQFKVVNLCNYLKVLTLTQYSLLPL